MKGFIIFIYLWLYVLTLKAQKATGGVDSLQYPKGYPTQAASVTEQLYSYPLPRYLQGHHLHELFNWMNPYYMAGRGQPKTANATVLQTSVLIQKELALNWHYGIVIPDAATAFWAAKANTCPPTIQLANENPALPLHIITFWLQVKPKQAGYKYTRPTITQRNFDSSLYISFGLYGKTKREIKFNFPDSLIQTDGLTQKYYLDKIISCLTRPVNMINENGEEPPGPYLIKAIKKDTEMVQLKEKMNINSWETFMAERKLAMRKTYSNQFMTDTGMLKNTSLSFYSVDAGPLDRFEWHVIKKSMSTINNIHYSTPDFYPRWPMNWKLWQGPWHGWKWIAEGRKTEIKDGDYLFSPFVCAGWSKKQEEDIRPGQWLGLLKCLSVVGAEFYYVGYFNLSAPFTNPANWAWQAAMPAYAQAITSRFEEELKNGNVLMNAKQEPIINYSTNDKHVLITARKHNTKNKYIICGSYQPFSNKTNTLPEKRIVSVTIDQQELQFEIRRQGSVYVYERTEEGKILFYQLDKWHENAHPDHWSKDFYFEAEVADTLIQNTHIHTTGNQPVNDFTNFITYVSLSANYSCIYTFTPRDTLYQTAFVWLKCRGEGTFNISAGSSKPQSKKFQTKKTGNGISLLYRMSPRYINNKN